MTNCVAGDLAVVVSGIPAENIGKVITVIDTIFTSDLWCYEGYLLGILGGRANAVQDSCLRPIRDNPGTDETLTWAGKPQPIQLPETVK